MTETKQDIRTKAFVLRRTNYHEADRILNLLTPEGKITAIAKGARREKSKLAGGIEMFCLVDLNIHRKTNDDIGIITSAKLVEYYASLVIDLPRLEVASLIIKKVNSAPDAVDAAELFDIVKQSLTALNQKKNPELVEAWFLFNYAKTCGEEVNLYRDDKGEKLVETEKYIWDIYESSLKVQVGGNIGADEIKIMRLMLTSRLEMIFRINNVAAKIPSILSIARAVNKI
ncbi:DNA repair protein RecO [Candidatus Saccharibacteria bacterium]|nr:DNA repair protein RecO [Candidatus Saccharibacteria bacterium]